MIKNAEIHFNETGTPVAGAFDDVYFSNDDGLAESDYVFYQQNRIPERLPAHPRPSFVIAETGFGTGLNFLNAWRRFDEVRLAGSDKRLHFISFEKFPLRRDDLKSALANWPTLTSYAEQLIARYPMALKGCHRLEFEGGRVVLDLWFGDVHDSIATMSYPPGGIVDAWFLDGFAPSKNPDMWQQSLFQAMATLARPDATFATFTAAGFVRRALQDAGFEVEKVRGFGRKREMIRGVLADARKETSEPPYYVRAARNPSQVAVIGAGIGGAAAIYSLAKRGIPYTLFCADAEPAEGASHNRQGAVYPQLQADYTVASELYAHSFLYAKRLYQDLSDNGHHFPHAWCGVLHQGVKDELAKRQRRLAEKATWPEALIRLIDNQEATRLAGVETCYGGLFMAEAGWVSPPRLVEALLALSEELQPGTHHFSVKIERLMQKSEGWYLETESTRYGPFSDVIIAAGEHSDQFEQTAELPLHGVRGQVSHLKASCASEDLQTVLCHKGYFTPALDGEHCMGATFEKNTKARDVREQDDQINLEQFKGFYGEHEFAEGLGQINGAKAAVRCCFADHLPMVGQIAYAAEYSLAFAGLRSGKNYGMKPLEQSSQGLHILTGFGARGLCSAPLCAELLVASLCNEPRPVSERLSQALHPARFFVRDLKRSLL